LLLLEESAGWLPSSSESVDDNRLAELARDLKPNRGLDEPPFRSALLGGEGDLEDEIQDRFA